jgi:hypothetical protein
MRQFKGSVSVVALLVLGALSVCTAQTLSDTAAKAITISGQVSILKDSQPWALFEGNQIKPGEIVITGPDGYALFRVSDGSTFEVFANSRVVFRDNPGNWGDLLNLLLGRIKVHIQKIGGQPNPNKVHTPTAIISVRGTTFDVSIEDGDSTLVMVEEGTVEVEHATLSRDVKRILNAGEWLKIYKNEPLAKNGIDRGSVVRRTMNAMADAIIRIAYSPAGGGSVPAGGGSVPGGGGTGGGAGPGPLPGDHGSTNPNDPGSTTKPGDAGPGAPTSPPKGGRN